MNLGENIHLLRKRKGLSQDDLAAALDVSRQSVSKWENNSAVPELDKLVKLSTLFDVTLDELVGSAPKNAPRVEAAQLSPRFSKREWVGILFFFFGAVWILAFAINGNIVGAIFPGSLPVACGCYWFFNFRHPFLATLWALCFPVTIFLRAGYMRADISLILLIVLSLILFLVTTGGYRRDPVVLTRKLKLFLIAGYVLWFGYILVSLLHYLMSGSHWRISLISLLIDSLTLPLFTVLFSFSERILRQNRSFETEI